MLGHELGHLTTYDTTEKTAEYVESKIGKDDLNKQFTESEREEYIGSLGDKHLPTLSEEEQFEAAKNIPENEREEKAWGISHNSAISAGVSINFGGSLILSLNDITKEIQISQTVDFGAGLGTPSIGNNVSFTYYPYINSSRDIDGANFGIGGSFNLIKKDIGIDIGIDLYNKRLDSYSLSTGVGKNSTFSEKFGETFKKFDTWEGHINLNNTKTILDFEISQKEIEKILRLEEEINNIDKKIALNSTSVIEKIKFKQLKHELQIKQGNEAKIILNNIIKRNSLLFSNPLLYKKNEQEFYNGGNWNVDYKKRNRKNSINSK